MTSINPVGANSACRHRLYWLPNYLYCQAASHKGIKRLCCTSFVISSI